MEAKKHRHRGISLEMFLSLMKYYRQAYLDLVRESLEDTDLIFEYQLWINRFFDLNEIAYIHEWTSKSDEILISEMQRANIKMTNEKNKYLTIFESTPNASILLDAEHHCINMNHTAQQLFNTNVNTTGISYYSEQRHPLLSELLPWIMNEYLNFIHGDKTEENIEKEFKSHAQGIRYLSVMFHRMLDVSNKFEGAVIIFNDLTDYKKIEEQLRFMSFHDKLTGLYNRAFLDEEFVRFASGRYNPVGLISIDVDGLKQVNDNLGHGAGDSLLVKVAQILKKSFRDGDMIVRMGGDEFVVLTPYCDMIVMEEACQRIEKNVITYNESGVDLPISISVGWSVGNLNENEKITEMMKEADSRMYTAKKVNHPRYVEMFKEWLINFGKN